MPPDGSLTTDEVIYIIRNRIGLSQKSGIYIIKKSEKLILIAPSLTGETAAQAENLLASLAERYEIIADEGVIAAE